MIDDHDLDAAVRSGVLDRNAARKLRDLSTARHSTAASDGERFRSIGSPSDILICVGLLLTLPVANFLLFAFTPMACILLAPLCWSLAEYITLRRRHLWASITIFAVFILVSAVALLAVTLAFITPHAQAVSLPTTPTGFPPLAGSVVAVGITMACMVWWWRFRLPIAFAASAVAAINALIHLGRLVAPDVASDFVAILLLAIGIGLFLMAMWWDITDVHRVTIRSDIAFWLHVAAGYQIAAASYRLLFGVAGQSIGWERLYSFQTLPATGGNIWPAILLFVLFTLLALFVDRRPLILSAMLFLGPAFARFPEKGLIGFEGEPLLYLGSFILLISLSWNRLRASLLTFLPVTVRAQLPRTEI